MTLYENLKSRYQLKKALQTYGKYFAENRKSIRTVLRYYRERKDFRIAIWGAGLKGKAFLKVIDPYQSFIDYVYDCDKKKMGDIMPTGHIVVDYTKQEFQNVKVVLLMNNVFETETACLLEEQNMNVIYINMDSVIVGKMKAREILDQYGRE